MAFEEALQQIIKWDHLSDKEIQKQDLGTVDKMHGELGPRDTALGRAFGNMY